MENKNNSKKTMQAENTTSCPMEAQTEGPRCYGEYLVRNHKKRIEVSVRVGAYIPRRVCMFNSTSTGAPDG